MFNVRNKTSLVAATVLLLCSCSARKDPRQTEAENLYNHADSALMAGNPGLALELLDSLDSNYKTVTEVIKKSIALRPDAVIRQSEKEIAKIDSAMRADNGRLDSLARLIKHVEIPGTDGFYIPTAAYNASFASTTGVSPRIDDLGQFYIVSSVSPAGGLSHGSLTFTSGDESVTTEEIPSGSDSRFAINNGEIVTFSPVVCDTVARFLSTLPSGAKVTVKFNGRRGRSVSSRVNLPAFMTAIEYSELISGLRHLTLERQRLEARIQTASRQASKAASTEEN